jgi:2-succinyl-6-hydroxy-2,4-cyclohexadiene-1-carboxylate synthase
LVCLHGFTGGPSAWEPVLECLGGAPEVYRPALLGHGPDTQPEAPGATFTGEVERLAAGVREIWNGAPAHLLAYSMGGRLGLGLLRGHGELFSGATLVGVHPGLPEAGERERRLQLDAERATSLRQEGIAAFVRHWSRLPLFATQKSLPEAVLEEQRRLRRNHRPEGLARALEVLGPARMPDYTPDLPSMHCPITLVAGERDGKFCRAAEQMALRLPRGVVEVVPGVGHNVVLEAPEVLARIVGRGGATKEGAGNDGNRARD